MNNKKIGCGKSGRQKVVEHVVLFQWTAEAAPEAIAAAIDEMRAMKGQIPGIVDLTCGENFADRAQGFQCALVVRFTDRAALDAYGPHPAHCRVAEQFINPIRANTIIVDYEFETL